MKRKDHILIVLYLVILSFIVYQCTSNITKSISELTVHYSSHNNITTEKTFVINGSYDIADISNSAVLGAMPVFEELEE